MISCEDTWLPELLWLWTSFVFDNLCKYSVDCFDSWHTFHLHVEVELLGNHLVQRLHMLTVLAHQFLNNLATRLVVTLFHWMSIASEVVAINVRRLMHNKWGYNRSLKFMVLWNVACISSYMIRRNLLWLRASKCTTLKISWARSSGLAISCNRSVEIENPSLSSILSDPLIRLIRIKLASCFRLTGALITDRLYLTFKVLTLTLVLDHDLLAASRGVRLWVELIVIWIISAQVNLRL